MPDNIWSFFFLMFFQNGSYYGIYDGASGNLRNLPIHCTLSVNQDMQAAAQWWFRERMAALGRPNDWSQQDQIGFWLAETKISRWVFMNDKTGSEGRLLEFPLAIYRKHARVWKELCEGVDRKDCSRQRPVVPEIWEARWGLHGTTGCAVRFSWNLLI